MRWNLGLVHIITSEREGKAVNAGRSRAEVGKNIPTRAREGIAQASAGDRVLKDASAARWKRAVATRTPVFLRGIPGRSSWYDEVMLYTSISTCHIPSTFYRV